MVRTVFYGSSEYSTIVLERLISSNFFDVVLCVSQSDKNTSNPVHEKAVTRRIKSIRTRTLKKAPYLKTSNQPRPCLKSSKPGNVQHDVGIVADFGLLIPKELFESIKFGYINIHPSLLPKYKGTIPAEAAILNMDQKTGVTLIKITDKFDEGPIIAQKEIALRRTETKFELYKTLFNIGAELAVSEIPKYIRGEIKPYPQKGEGSYCPKISKEAGRIDWTLPAQKIEAMIRAYEGWPGTFTTLEELVKTNNPSIQISNKSRGKIVKILKAHLENGQIVIDKLQIEGKTPITWDQFRHGYLR